MYILLSIYATFNFFLLEYFGERIQYYTFFECSFIFATVFCYYTISFFCKKYNIREQETPQVIEFPTLIFILYIIIFDKISIYIPFIIYSSWLVMFFTCRKKPLFGLVLKYNLYLRNVFLFYFLFFMLLIDICIKIEPNLLYFYFCPLIYLIGFIYSIKIRNHLISCRVTQVFNLLLFIVFAILLITFFESEDIVKIVIYSFLFYSILNSLIFFIHLIRPEALYEQFKINQKILDDKQKTIFYNPKSNLLDNDIEILFDNGVYIKLIDTLKFSPTKSSANIKKMKIEAAIYLTATDIKPKILPNFLKIYDKELSYINKKDIDILEKYELTYISNYLKLKNMQYSSLTDIDFQIIDVLSY
jgi:hypothetical protein